MMNLSRRSLLSAIGVGLPLGLGGRTDTSEARSGPGPSLRMIPFEQAVRAAFSGVTSPSDPSSSRRRIEVGHSELVQAGVQGCHNDRPFAGFPAGHLRIVRAGSEPGPVWSGVRLYVSTVDVVLTGGLANNETPSRPLDFGSVPAAPAFS